MRMLDSRLRSARVMATRPTLRSIGTRLRCMSDSAVKVEEQYAKPLQWMHWLYAGGFVTVLGTVLASKNTTGPTFLGTKGKTKGTLMMIHKSTAVVLSVLFFPRLLLRAATTAPKALPISAPEHFAANLSHVTLYGAMVAMPFTGLSMGYYGGKGVPFFGVYTFPGKVDKTKEDGQYAGKMVRRPYSRKCPPRSYSL